MFRLNELTTQGCQIFQCATYDDATFKEQRFFMSAGTSICRLIAVLLLCIGLAPISTGASDTPLSKGVLLVATDRLQGTSFSKTVILLTQVDAQGAMGVAINRRSQRLLNEFFPNIKNNVGSHELYLGGPVHPLSLFVLTRPTPGKNWLSVLDEIAFSGGEVAFDFLLQLKPEKGMPEIRAYAGYAGWAPGQLKAEVERGDWRIIPGDKRLIFSGTPDDLWGQLSKNPTELWI